MEKIFLLQEKHYYYYDENDGENVEDKFIIGYFKSVESLNKAIDTCLNNGIEKKYLVVEEIEFHYTRKQKYIYLLNYEYSIINNNGDYEDFYYSFDPFTNKKKCLQQKNELIKQEKYRVTENKIFDVSKDDFYIDKILLDYIAHIPNKKK